MVVFSQALDFAAMLCVSIAGTHGGLDDFSVQRNAVYFDLRAVNIFRHRLMCAVAYCEGFAWKPSVFPSVAVL